MSFQETPCSPALLELFGREHPSFYHAVRFEFEKRLPLTKFTLYSYSTDITINWYGFKENKAITSEVYFCSTGKFGEKEFVEGFRLFNETVRLTDSGKSFYLVADQCFTDALKSFFVEIDWNWKEYPNYNYVMTKEQEDIVMLKETPNLPEGYTIGDATVEDAELITSTWKYSEKNELLQTRMKISALPSTCVRFNGEPIGFEMLDPNGTLNHLFVLEEHRGKGIGIAIHIEQIKKCLREGFHVSKLVEPSNKNVVAASDKSPIWTKFRDSDGTPVIRVYLAVWPKDREFLEE